MANNYLITGYWGEPHVTPENDRGFNAAVFGPGRFVLPVGEQFRAEYIGNNTVRVYDGKLMDNGALAGIPVGAYVDLLIPEAGQGMKRSDLIVFQYAKDPSTLVETGRFVVLSGEESTGTAYDPPLTQQDLLTDTAALDQMPLWRVTVSGAVINAPARMFSTGGAGGNLHVLWENAAPTADFTTQTVKLSDKVQDFSEIVVGFRAIGDASGSFATHYERLPVRAGAQANAMLGAWAYVFNTSATMSLYSRVTRFVSIYQDVGGVYFGSGSVTRSGMPSSDVTTDNNVCVPVIIYGVRGDVIA